jgi:hypothetical protein
VPCRITLEGITVQRHLDDDRITLERITVQRRLLVKLNWTNVPGLWARGGTEAEWGWAGRTCPEPDQRHLKGLQRRVDAYMQRNQFCNGAYLHTNMNNCTKQMQTKKRWHKRRA